MIVLLIAMCINCLYKLDVVCEMKVIVHSFTLFIICKTECLLNVLLLLLLLLLEIVLLLELF